MGIRSLSFFLFFLPLVSFAQENLGLQADRYSGISLLETNPANGHIYPLKWDFQFFSFGHFSENNIAYLGNTSVLDLVKNGEMIYPSSSLVEEVPPSGAILLDLYQNSDPYKVYTGNRIGGPGLMIHLKNEKSIAISSKLRAEGGSFDLPNILGYYQQEALDFFETFEVPSFSVAAMVWRETAITYSQRINPYQENPLYLGVTAKFLAGYEGVYLNNKQSLSLTQFPGDSISFDHRPEIEIGFTNYAYEAAENYSPQVNGRGMSFDIGVNYIVDADEDGYLMRFGAALLDIGKVNFRDYAETHLLSPGSNHILDTDLLREEAPTEFYTNIISAAAYGDSSASLVANKLSIATPAALSLDFDYSMSENLFVRAQLIQRLAFQGNAVKRANLIAVYPRWEHRWFSFALPIQMYEYSDLRVGASARLAFLTIGSDHLGSLFNKSEFTGSSIYISLKLNPFNWPFRKLNMPVLNTGKRGGNVKCYKF